MGEDRRNRFPNSSPRREFLRASLALLGGLAASAFPSVARGISEACGRLSTRISTPPPVGFSRSPVDSSGSRPAGLTSRAMVVVARKNRRGNASEVFYADLLQASLKRLTGAGKTEDAWAQFFAPDDIVAIKVNSITGQRLSSSPALVAAITKGLSSCGVPARNMIIWDRTTPELEKAGFAVNFAREAPLCFGTDARSVGYESSPTELGGVGSCFSRIVTQHATALINVPVLREHALAGVSIALKNYYGAIHNPNKYHSDGCSPFVADVSTHPDIKGKTRLNICDAMRVQFHGGPGYKPKWVAEFGGILVSTDPVALDTVGTHELEKLRKSNGLRTLREEGRYPAYLSVASDEKHALGISDRSRIDVINMELA